MKYQLNRRGYEGKPINSAAIDRPVDKYQLYFLSIVLIAMTLLESACASSAEFTVNVKTDRTDRAIPSYLTGAVGDVVTTAQTTVLSQTLSYDVAPLLDAFGVSYVRLHDTRAMNAAESVIDPNNTNWFHYELCECTDSTGAPASNCSAIEFNCSDTPSNAYQGEVGSGEKYLSWVIGDQLSSMFLIREAIADMNHWDIDHEGRVWSTCKALTDYGIPVMFRAGEDGDNAHYHEPHVTYGHLPYAHALAFYANAITTGEPWLSAGDPNVSPCGAPVFVNIGNEPDGAYFTGPHWHDNEARASEWVSTYGTVERILRNQSAFTSAEIGGPGFTYDYFRCWVEDSLGNSTASLWCPSDPSHNGWIVESIMNEISNRSLIGKFDWLSYHLYPSSVAFGDDLMTNDEVKPSALFSFLQDASDAVDAWDGPLNLPLHITEYRLGDSSDGCHDQAENNGGESTCSNSAGAAFVSALLSWMSWPDFRYESAAYYSTHFAHGLFVGGTNRDLRYDPTDPVDPDRGRSLQFDVATEPCVYADPAAISDDEALFFLVRRPAMAFYFHSPFAGLRQLESEIVYSLTIPVSVKDAALADYAITALSAEVSEQEDMTIVTNYSTITRTVQIDFEGLDPNTFYLLTVEALNPNISELGCAVEATAGLAIAGKAGGIQPVSTQLAALMDDLVDSTTSRRFSGTSGTVSTTVVLDPYSFVRVRASKVL